MTPQETVAQYVKADADILVCGTPLADAFGCASVTSSLFPVLTFYVELAGVTVLVCEKRTVIPGPGDIVVGDKIVGIMQKEVPGC